MCLCIHNTHACLNNFLKSNQGSSALKTSTLSITTQQRCIENKTTMLICVCYFLSIPHPQNIVKCMRKVGSIRYNGGYDKRDKQSKRDNSINNYIMSFFRLRWWLWLCFPHQRMEHWYRTVSPCLSSTRLSWV